MKQSKDCNSDNKLYDSDKGLMTINIKAKAYDSSDHYIRIDYYQPSRRSKYFYMYIDIKAPIGVVVNALTFKVEHVTPINGNVEFNVEYIEIR